MAHEPLTFSAAKIRELLYTQDQSQEWLASETGYTPETVSRYMNGHLPITLKFAAKASRAFGVPIHWLQEDRVAA